VKERRGQVAPTNQMSKRAAAASSWLAAGRPPVAAGRRGGGRRELSKRGRPAHASAAVCRRQPANKWRRPPTCIRLAGLAARSPGSWLAAGHTSHHPVFADRAFSARARGLSAGPAE